MFNIKYLLPCIGVIVLCSSYSVQAQEHRSAWMWSLNPYGTGTILGDPRAEDDLIDDFTLWGFDRIYTSMGSLSTLQPSVIAHWNAGLDDAGIQSQMLLGEASWVFPGSGRTSLLNTIQTRLISYNAARTDPRELIDGLHLDIEPHALSEWKNGTDTDRRDLLLLLGDTYADVRNLLDANGQSQVKIYADLPVWYDSSTSIAWVSGERDQWFTDIAQSLDGISMMAYERSTLSNINNGVQWEIDNFDGEVRIGLESNAVGVGQTWPTFQALLDMADALEAYHGTDIGGIDFHPLRSFALQSEHTVNLPGDINDDGFVGLADLDIILANWNLFVPEADWRADVSGEGYVGLADLDAVLSNWNTGTLPGETEAVVPEPAGVGMLALGGLTLLRRART